MGYMGLLGMRFCLDFGSVFLADLDCMGKRSFFSSILKKASLWVIKMCAFGV